MSPDVIAAGVFSIAGAVLGAVVGLFGARWVRSWGKVGCKVDDWRISVGTPKEPEERRLQVTFLNKKEIPVVVVEMQVEFYKEGKLLEDWAHPTLQFVDEASGLKSALSVGSWRQRTKRSS